MKGKVLSRDGSDISPCFLPLFLFCRIAINNTFSGHVCELPVAKGVERAL
jgi:hypothetical protein